MREVTIPLKAAKMPSETRNRRQKTLASLRRQLEEMRMHSSNKKGKATAKSKGKQPASTCLTNSAADVENDEA